MWNIVCINAFNPHSFKTYLNLLGCLESKYHQHDHAKFFRLEAHVHQPKQQLWRWYFHIFVRKVLYDFIFPRNEKKFSFLIYVILSTTGLRMTNKVARYTKQRQYLTLNCDKECVYILLVSPICHHKEFAQDQHQ